MMSPIASNTNAACSGRTNVVQINLNHCWAAQQLLLQTMKELSAKIAIISDYYRPMGDAER